ncbi:hypothetical protein LCGC14_0835180 [marine sediment metagenome]|uniref:Leucine-rich repeat domain-containing protein n=1 Tax=marine sediment metagenome TaxID=412755 RepID=A0A0F9SM82_9ZZZZ|nr:leucine-rich repeat domain-containing protein [bacterium]
MREFKVNNLIKLRLIDGKTILFVNNREFKQCKILLLNLPIMVNLVQKVLSIDEVAESLDNSMESEANFLLPEEEFIAHCSNVQAWFENQYNTALLHRTLAFPLLRALSEEGDLLAKERFKEEIAIRYKYGNKAVQTFLYVEGYLDYLTYNEKFSGILAPEDAPFMEEILDSMRDYMLIPDLDLIIEDERGNGIFFCVKNGRIKELELDIENKLRQIPSQLEKLESLERLHLYIKSRSDNIFSEKFSAKSVKYLTISCNIMGTTIPDLFHYFPNLVRLKIVGFHSKPVIKFETSFTRLLHLESLYLVHVNIEKLPDTILNLEKLRVLILRDTSIRSLSVTIIESIKSLTTLKLQGNSKLELTLTEVKKLKKKINFFKYY